MVPGYKKPSHCNFNVDGEDSHKPGTALIWKNNLHVTGAVNLTNCRLQMAEIGPYKFFNCYAPSGSENRFARNQFYGEDVFKYLKLQSDSTKILVGDHNCVLRKEDIENGIGFSQKYCQALDTLVKCEHLVDCYIHLPSITQEYTFHRPGKAKSRLDRFYVSDFLLRDIVCIDHMPSLSDHFGVKLTMKIDIKRSKFRPKRDYSFWKLNNRILDDDEFLPSFLHLWKYLLKFEHNYGNVADWWDECVKPQIKDFCIGFSSYRKDKRNQTKQMLLQLLKASMVENDWEEVIRVRELLNNMLMEDLTGFKVRSRFLCGPESERSSLFHAARELKNHKGVNSGLKIGGSIVTDKEEIEEEVVSFFNALFNGHHSSDLINTGTPFVPDWSNLDILLDGLGKISNTESNQLVENMKMEEMDFVVKKCPKMRSPGLDGLTYEFYQKVWEVIGSKFLEILQVQLARCQLIASDTMGATKLIPKVESVPRVDELRPITLLNTDYKLLTKWMVLRLKPLMGSLLKSGQLCNAGDKNILFGVQNLLSSIEYVKHKKLRAALVSLDFFKAYDRLYLPFLLKVLSKMNFNDTFCNWVKMLHHGANTRFKLGFLTRQIFVSFSVRQGDPLAMLLYVLYIEPLLLLLQRTVKGLNFSSQQPQIQSQVLKQVSEAFCDDVNLVVTNDSDFYAIDKAVIMFEKASGAILSRNKKCLVLGLGVWSNRQSWTLDFLQPVKEMKVFGIWLMNSYTKLVSKNWSRRVESFRRTVFSWSGRFFSNIKQKIEVLNCFALSRIFYVGAVLPVTKVALKTINSIISDFIWKKSGMVLKIAHNELVNSDDRGGMALLDTESMCNSLIASQMFRLMKSSDLKSHGHLKFWLSDFLSDVWEGPNFYLENNDIESEHFNKLAELLVNVRMLENLDFEAWSGFTNKIIYRSFAECFPKTKVERDASFDMAFVWQRLHYLRYDRAVQEVAYLMVHNKLPVQERLFRIRLSRDPYCLACATASIQDINHYFIGCERTLYYWNWTKNICNSIMGHGNTDEVSFLMFNWPKCKKDREISWIIGHYVYIVWDLLYRRKSASVSNLEFFGFLKFKYKEALAIGAVRGIPNLL